MHAFVWGCESLLAAVESGSEFSLEELYLIDLYAEVITQTSAAGLFHLRHVAPDFYRESQVTPSQPLTRSR